MLPIILSVLAVIAVAWTLAYHRASALAWSVALAAGAACLTWLAARPPASSPRPGSRWPSSPRCRW